MCNYGLVNHIVWQLQTLLGAGRVEWWEGVGILVVGGNCLVFKMHPHLPAKKQNKTMKTQSVEVRKKSIRIKA